MFDTMKRLVITALVVVATTEIAFAQGGVQAAQAALQGTQTDFSGTWANRIHEDWVERAPGPHIGDYTGLPINDEARAVADAYQVSMQNMPERQCILYTSQYIVMGPQNLRIEQQLDPISGAVVALHMSGTVDRAPRTIWVDGRPHPSKNAPHSPGGFSTGVWQGTMLTATTTHLKTGLVWRNGVPHSDQATMTEHFVRHGDLLTITMILEDPVYWEEPFIRSATLPARLRRAGAARAVRAAGGDPAEARRGAALSSGSEPVSRRVREDLQPAARSRARRRGDDVSGGTGRSSARPTRRRRSARWYCCGGTTLTAPNTTAAMCADPMPATPAPGSTLTPPAVPPRP